MKREYKNNDIFHVIENWAPKHLAYEWDNVGLQIGSYNKTVKKVMITLDVLESVVDEAIEKNIDLIIAHHPLLFNPVKRINLDTPQGRIIHKLLTNQITVYAAHTNLDAANGGVNDMLCDLLGIASREILTEVSSQKLYKIAVYVPTTHVDQVRSAMSENGAGHIGNYSHCTFQTNGQGTFKPLEGAAPYIGAENELEFVDEIKIETIVKEERITKVINGIIGAHPYEEVAYDIFPLKNQGETFGIGRIGTLSATMKLRDLCEHVKSTLDVPNMRVIGDLDKRVRKIAILGGSGEKYIHLARQKGADVYITGDMSFHVAQDAWQMGLPVIDAGHNIEKVMKQATKLFLEKELNKDWIEIITSETSTEPFQFI
ncbi:Nif3-like dinuclear metal center hexameric protein [Oceanobacillus zhaokaii]|uniref:GTP cyclohydrolase 1 type 2 homolog n=1 Tax=Oceanobacillus zhaokaii TaxID=2052660 RepID=A0A345PHJ5_9BACI|nr:Nif3-like dinuclear metal center hexameric protein [Oceanobacillus zhaokaii]AXI09475.1 Nif3-like dinuclear metal center hexameric protein [Oceanobacillus zhaokaii]